MSIFENQAVYRCCECGAGFSEEPVPPCGRTLDRSGWSRGAWSDGVALSCNPGLRTFSLVVCPECDVPVWIDRCESRRYSWDDPVLANVPSCHGANAFHILEAVDRAEGDRDRQRVALMALWDRENDKRRSSPRCSRMKLSGLGHGCASRLLEYLDENLPEERLLMIEIHRELGHFDKAQALLAFDFPPEYSARVEKQSEWISNRTSALLQFSPMNRPMPLDHLVKVFGEDWATRLSWIRKWQLRFSVFWQRFFQRLRRMG